MTDFDSYLAGLCSKVLEFQARATCYLWKHRVSRALRDTFKRDGWDSLLNDLKEGDNIVEKYTTRIEGVSHTESLKRIEAKQTAAAQWNALSDREKRVKLFLEKLYDGTCHYRDAKNRNDERVPGTCEWFTNHHRFLEWTETKESALLWVSADPGCGKSVLARYLIDDVLPSTSKITVCYFFFKDDFPDQNGATSALCALLRQIFLAKPYLLSDSLLTKAETDGSKFISSLGDLWSTFISIATDRNAGHFVVVLDALDECRDSERSQLIKNIRTLYSHGSQLCHIKFLMTSRPYHHIKAEFHELEESLPTIHLGHLSAENEIEVDKISREIDLVIDYRVKKICRERNLQSAEQKYLQEQIKGTDKSQRTYLWVTLVLDVIKNKPGFSRGKVRQSLGEIPQKLDDAYEKILARSPDQKGARKILSILIAATRPLSVEEISIMSAVEQKHKLGGDLGDYLEDDFQDTLRATCGLFVVIIDTKVYLLHQTAREFLVPVSLAQNPSPRSMTTPLPWKGSILPASSNRFLAEICIWYIFELEEKSHPSLKEYSANNWVVHFNTGDLQGHQDTIGLAQRLCEPSSTQFGRWSTANIRRLPPLRHSLSIASYLGLIIVVKELLNANVQPDVKEKTYVTPLHLASHMGHDAIVQLLLDAGAQVDTRDNINRTPLDWASHMGHDAIVQLLLNAGAQVDTRDFINRTPLHWASLMGRDTSAQLLLDAGAQVDAMDDRNWTPLHWASFSGYNTIVQLLLNAGAQVDTRDNSNWTPLHLASISGYNTIVQLLLNAGAQVDTRG